MGLFTVPADTDNANNTTEQELSPPLGERISTEVEFKTAEEAKPDVKEEATEQKAVEQNKPNEEVTAIESEKTETAGGVDPDLKAFLDSYEEFIDEYVDFMKKYQADPSNTISMLGEYSDMMQKYADFAEKIDKYDSDVDDSSSLIPRYGERR